MLGSTGAYSATSDPATPDTPAPSPNVTAYTARGLTPTIRAISRSCAVARIMRPRRVEGRSHESAAPHPPPGTHPPKGAEQDGREEGRGKGENSGGAGSRKK